MDEFLKELKELLLKYDAEISIKEGHSYSSSYYLLVEISKPNYESKRVGYMLSGDKN